MTAPKRDTPSTEYKNKKRNKRPPTFVSCGTAPTIVKKSTFKLLFFLTILNTLMILKIVTTVATAPAAYPAATAMRPSQATTTMVKSKLFQPSAKYPRP